MAITFPLAFPVCRYSGSYQFGITPTVAVSSSPFSGEQQVYEWSAAPWQASFEVIVRSPEHRAAMMSFIASMRGRRGTVLLGPRHASRPRGTANTSGVTVGSGGGTTGGRTLPLAGLGAAATLLAGDFLQISSGANSRLHCIVENATADGSGNATVTIEAPLRADYASGVAVTLTSPKGVFRSTTNEFLTYMQMGGVLTASFSFIEAL